MNIREEYSSPQQPTIIDPTVEEAEKFGFGWGSDLTELTRSHLTALMEGKVLAFHDGEYTHFLILRESEDDPRGI